MLISYPLYYFGDEKEERKRLDAIYTEKLFIGARDIDKVRNALDDIDFINPQWSWICVKPADKAEVERRLCIHGAHMALESTGIKVSVYDQYGKYIGEADIVDLKAGDYVREIGALHKVTGNMYEDEIDYMIPTEECDYSPLCLESHGKEIKTLDLGDIL